MKFKEIFSLFLDAIYPPRCPFCGEMMSPGETLCETCAAENIPIFITRTLELQNRPETIPCKVLYHYKSGVQHAILDLKFHDVPENAAFFAKKMTEMILSSYNTLHIDFITAVPISKERRRERGYNQTELLAKQMVKNSTLKYAVCLEKQKNNREQHKLPAAQRKTNVVGVYRCINPDFVKGKNILLLDDVVTTGYTMGECAETLYNAGAKCVVCAAIATSSVESDAPNLDA